MLYTFFLVWFLVTPIARSESGATGSPNHSRPKSAQINGAANQASALFLGKFDSICHRFRFQKSGGLGARLCASRRRRRRRIACAVPN
ncbi:hypothetical protein B0H15DRAFT_825900 [Mycena belliarum]|uniref:Secreted protein n=1 Tax=Mycena belliarum TaxID=1033014 RepID=A0AAD6UB76_9AGAR|nr:hypothetical protein B0H15DRAFT_825900 [Mycena belliae]